jgi:hypothetical protein
MAQKEKRNTKARRPKGKRLTEKRRKRRSTPKRTGLEYLEGIFTGMILGPTIREMLGQAAKTAPEGWVSEASDSCPCRCHVAPPLLGITCPPDCTEGKFRFDGCHECDCSTGKFYEKHQASRKKKTEAKK